MSALLPIHPAQLERWQRPRPEPVVLELADWTLEHTIEPDETFPNERATRWRRGESTIELRRIWDLPRNPGYPMQIASTRRVDIAGRAFDIATTSMFEGVARVVQACWLRGEGHDVTYTVRLVFDQCSDDVVTDVLARLNVRW